MRRKKEVQLVPCPTCGQPMAPQVAAMVQQLGGKRRQLRTNRCKVGRNGWAFESTAEALPMQREAKWRKPEPVQQIAAPMSEAPLSPGEHRESKTYRQRSMLDVAAPLAWAGVSSMLVGVASVPICMALKAEWYWPVLTWLGSGAVAWFIASRDFLDDDKLVTSVQEMSRKPEAVPIIRQPPAVNLEIIDREKRAVDRICLHSPAGNAQGLAEYADALLRGTAMPSMDGGKDSNGARAYGYTEAEFERWRQEAVRARLLASRGKNQGYEITPRGRRSFEQIARLELESMSYD